MFKGCTLPLSLGRLNQIWFESRSGNMTFKVGDIVVRRSEFCEYEWVHGQTPTKVIAIEQQDNGGGIKVDLGGRSWWDGAKFLLYNATVTKPVKAPLDMLFRIKFIQDVADVFEFGEKKYPTVNGDFSWRSRTDIAVFVKQRFGSCLRHIFAHIQGEKLDSESNKPHLAHAVCNLLMIADVEFKGE